ncbi:MAG TPA: TonB-dependent receptor plug domain-containing protein [Spirochaetota bacterium]|nr:TonB-dependent receptor plug domain-containing protein [Spirochaetota bacterium]
MKKFLGLVFTTAFLLTGTVLYSQETVTDKKVIEKDTSEQDVVTDEKAVVKDIKGSDVKKKTRSFENGGIVVKGDEEATIDKATMQKVVTEKDIEAHNDKGLNDTLDTVPGFQIYQHGKGHVRFRMRGFEMPYVAILVDGIPLADVYEANLDISKIPVLNAAEIIINRGTCSALYGTTGTIGSINVVSKKPLGLYAKSSIELGLNGDYTINMAQGDAAENFYYWVTAYIEKEEPFDVSAKLTKSERLKWYDRFFPDFGYTNTTTPLADSLYLTDTGEWPHQESFKYNIAGKAGYQVFDNLEAGINASYTESEALRYSNDISTTNIATHTGSTGAFLWSFPTNKYGLSAGAFNWRDTYTVNLSPYVSFDNGDLKVRANVFYIYNYEFLDGYADADETTAIRGWGGAHSNWDNTSAGFNIFPSYKLNKLNNISTSILFRWDRHEEKVEADPQFASNTSNSNWPYWAAYHAAGDDYDFLTVKDMTAEQLTFGIEDDIDFGQYNIPVNVSIGISYDAQNFDTYKKRNRSGSDYTNYSYSPLDDQYIVKDDSTLWGTRDSFNPVIGVVYEPVKDFLLLRTSFSKKSKLPTMTQYASVSGSSMDTGLKTEKSYNTNAGFEFFFLDKAVSFRTDYFFTRFDDRLATIYDSTTFVKTYTNIKGENHQGVEAVIAAAFDDVLGIMSVDTECSYTYLHVRNLDTGSQESDVYKGKKLTDIPEHQVNIDFRFKFITNTSLNIFGSYTANAIKYAMASVPAASSDPYSTSYYKEVSLHDPLMINIKISQTFMERYEVFAVCKNVMDDYAADPFNPGPGRQFSFGLKAEL